MTPRGIADDLLAQLAGYSPSDGAEAAAVTAVIALLDGVALLDGEDPFSAKRFEPGHVTASAFVVHPTERAVALIFHSKIRRWLQPGGHVEPDDPSILDAALREVGEEVGVGATGRPWLCDVDVHTFPARGDVPTHLHHDVRFAFRSDSDTLLAGDGADAARWWSFEEAAAFGESLARPVAKLAEWASG